MIKTNKNALPNGTVLHQYKIESMLAYGGFGIVYLARHQKLDMQVVIKEFLPSEIATREGTTVHPLGMTEHADYEEGLQRFLDEAKQLVQFQSHANIVGCRDFFAENGTAYLIMDYAEGLSLGDLLQKRAGQPLSEQEILRIMLPLLDGLSYVHSHGVLHRDIKPGNIYIKRNDEQPILIDFGAAKQNFSKHSKSMAPYSPGYAAFEQVSEDGELGPWTDIYAIGAVMWRMVSGHNPPEVEKRMAATIRQKPDPMTAANDLDEAGYSQAFLAVIDKCLSLTEEGRFQSVSELLQALDTDDHITSTSSHHSTDASQANTGSTEKVSSEQLEKDVKTKPGKHGFLGAVILVLVLAIIGGGYFIYDYRSDLKQARDAQRKAELDLKRQAEAEQKRIQEAERKRQAALEQKRQARAEQKRIQEAERKRKSVNSNSGAAVTEGRAIYKKVIANWAAYSDNRLKLIAPPIAENGAVVVVNINTPLPISHKVKIWVFVDENPEPVSLKLELAEGKMADLSFSTRIKLQRSSYISVVMDRGENIWAARKYVNVTIGANMNSTSHGQRMGLRVRGIRNKVKMLITSPMSNNHHVKSISLLRAGIRLATIYTTKSISKNPYFGFGGTGLENGRYIIDIKAFNSDRVGSSERITKAVELR